jgi:hypothetical protein
VGHGRRDRILGRPVTGGLLTLASWRLIFFINVPAGAAALVLLARDRPVAASPGVVRLGRAGDGRAGHGRADLRRDRSWNSRPDCAAGTGRVRGRRGQADRLPGRPGPRCSSDDAAGAVPVARCGHRQRDGVRVRRRLLRPAVRDEPVPAAGAGLVRSRRGRGVLADDADRRVPDPVQRSAGREAGRPAADHRRLGADDGRTSRHRRCGIGCAGVGPGPADDPGRAGRSAGDAADDRRPAQQRPGPPHRHRQRDLQHQPPGRRRAGRRGVRCPAGQPGRGRWPHRPPASGRAAP